MVQLGRECLGYSTDLRKQGDKLKALDLSNLSHAVNRSSFGSCKMLPTS